MSRWTNMNVISADQEQKHEIRLKAINYEALQKRLYKEGVDWGFEGKNIEDAIDEIIFKDVLTKKKDIVNFRRGYERGVQARIDYELGMTFQDVNMVDLPQEYINNSYFLRGYRNSFQQNNNTPRR